MGTTDEKARSRLTIVLDTSVLIDVLRGGEDARAATERALEEDKVLMISVLSRTELFSGMLPREEPALRALLDRLPAVPVDERIADLAGGYSNQYRRSHSGIDLPDYLIAATAVVLDAELWTLNVRDFPMFPGLTRPY